MLRSRYNNLYIPSDFFGGTFAWTEAFPLHRPFQLGHSCSFHVMHKEVGSVESNEAVLEPTDADHLYSAKVYTSVDSRMERLFTVIPYKLNIHEHIFFLTNFELVLYLSLI